MIYILIIIGSIYYGGYANGGEVTTIAEIEFSSQKSCEQAREALDHVDNIKTVCVAK